jgi:hypothetical protein
MRRAEPGDFPQGKAILFYIINRLFSAGAGGGIKKDHGCARRMRRTRSGRSPRTQTLRHSIFPLCSCSPMDDIWRGFLSGR